MRLSSDPTARRGWRRLGLACVVLTGLATAVSAQTPAGVVRVEEDWELVVATPDPDIDGPQVSCVISPTGNLGSVHAAFELNQRSLPSFQPGGLQLQLWRGETPTGQTQGPGTAVMRTEGETVTWTQVMRLSGDYLVFEVVNGSSTTWGAFGGAGYLKIAVWRTLLNLDGYRPEVSVENSGIGFASNRVHSLVLKRVRYTTSTGQVVEDATARAVYEQP